ncbi:hypothetical protein [Brevibacillus borstelensis]|nr:hypothetical protein [Brevibacillus borstelensis]MED1744354.1 hypothetical protein [Brevibacillus borstelensis]MED1874276.1 hypothetical protein [Brevibacillus borstelensis]MED1881706.1 hypothetical protein [Brevibacillus borstelensis]
MSQKSEGLSADDLALLAAVIVLIGDILALLALVRERQEKTKK